LFSDYIFNNSAGNNAGTPLTISGPGEAPSVDLYFYRAPEPLPYLGAAPLRRR
jgi:hypothetical protein